MQAYVTGVGMTHFGRHLETGLKALGGEAVLCAIADAGVDKDDIEAAFVGNAAAGLLTGQECIRGQVVLRSVGIGKIPVVNVENACASDTLALHDRPNPLLFQAARLSVERACRQAGITPDQIDLFELYDSTSIFAALSLEAAGYALPGEGWRLAQNGPLALTGRLPMRRWAG